MKVLIVEDSPSVAMVMRRFVEPFADEIIVTGDMASALQVIDDVEHGDIELITLDLGLPDSMVFESLEAIKRIRSRRPGSLLIVVTGQDITDIEEKAIAAGADGILLKQGSGFNPEGFFKMLRTVVGKCLATPATHFQQNIGVLETIAKRLASFAQGDALSSRFYRRSA